ncbi:MAG: ClpXP protease specificity-enhancing factor SspB [Croceibacterium sp.]
MSDDAPDSLIPYDEIVQEALRAVVGRVLGEVQHTGGTLPGNHHFYITFKTAAPGVNIPQHLKERFPDEMTIVLQNKFWDLAVDEEGFRVGLSFNAIPAKLQIPFAAITAFVDPAVDFGLQFQAAVTDIEPAAHEDAENDSPDGDKERGAGQDVGVADDGSNVVTVDFGRKK